MTKQPSANIPLGRNPAAPLQGRLDDLLPRMTLEKGGAGGAEACARLCEFRDLADERTKWLPENFDPARETQAAALDITLESLANCDIPMNYSIEPAEFEIVFGNSSRDCDLQKPILMLTR